MKKSVKDLIKRKEFQRLPLKAYEPERFTTTGGLPSLEAPPERNLLEKLRDWWINLTPEEKAMEAVGAVPLGPTKAAPLAAKVAASAASAIPLAGILKPTAAKQIRAGHKLWVDAMNKVGDPTYTRVLEKSGEWIATWEGVEKTLEVLNSLSSEALKPIKRFIVGLGGPQFFPVWQKWPTAKKIGEIIKKLEPPPPNLGGEVVLHPGEMNPITLAHEIVHGSQYFPRAMMKGRELTKGQLDLWKKAKQQTIRVQDLMHSRRLPHDPGSPILSESSPLHYYTAHELQAEELAKALVGEYRLPPGSYEELFWHSLAEELDRSEGRLLLDLLEKK